MSKTDSIDTEKALAEQESETLDALTGVAQESDEDDPAANTYSAIAKLQREQEAKQRRLKPGLPEETVLINGAVPRQPGNVWNDVDRSVVDRAPPGPWTGTKLAPE